MFPQTRVRFMWTRQAQFFAHASLALHRIVAKNSVEYAPPDGFFQIQIYKLNSDDSQAPSWLGRGYSLPISYCFALNPFGMEVQCDACTFYTECVRASFCRKWALHQTLLHPFCPSNSCIFLCP